jgi:hypothetical protein
MNRPQSRGRHADSGVPRLRGDESLRKVFNPGTAGQITNAQLGRAERVVVERGETIETSKITIIRGGADRIRKADVLRLWPENAPPDAPTALANAAPSTIVAEASRPRPTHAALRTSFQHRVATWPDDLPAPSEETDWREARAHFGDGMSRADFRPFRRDNTPPEWQISGPRKPWGQLKNSAKNSAKLPRQH